MKEKTKILKVECKQMNYQQRIKSNDDPLSVAIDADREIEELKGRPVGFFDPTIKIQHNRIYPDNYYAYIRHLEKENKELKANNARLRDGIETMRSVVHHEYETYGMLVALLNETKPQSLAAIQHDAVKPLLDAMNEIYRLANCDNYVTAEAIYREFDDVMQEAKSLIEGE